MSSDRDVLTDTEARAYLGIGPADYRYADVLPIAVTAVSRKLDEMVGPIVAGTAGTITGELHDGGMRYVWLDQSPVLSVTQVVEYDETTAGTLTAETNATKPDSAYRVELATGKVLRRSQNATVRFPDGIDNVSVSYVCGRYTSTATVDDRFKFAAGVMLKSNWRMFEASVASVGEFDAPHLSFPSFAVPRAVKEWLADEWRQGRGF